MDVGELITRFRKQAGMTIDELAKQADMPKGTLTKIIGGVTKSPSLDNMKAIARALGKTLADFDDLPAGETGPSMSDDALKAAKDFDTLDRYGQTLVKLILLEELKRVSDQNIRAREKELYLDVGEPEPTDRRVIPLYLTPAAAGYTSPVFGEDFEYLEVGSDVPRHADFAVKIDGDSMEPYIMDSSTVYVNRDPLSDGDVGIFCLDGDMLCKQYHKGSDGTVHLLSLNRARADADRTVAEGSTLACFGRVILPHRLELPQL